MYTDVVRGSDEDQRREMGEAKEALRRDIRAARQAAPALPFAWEQRCMAESFPRHDGYRRRKLSNWQTVEEVAVQNTEEVENLGLRAWREHKAKADISRAHAEVSAREWMEQVNETAGFQGLPNKFTLKNVGTVFDK